ncbi:MAG: hypothetical protein JO034_18900, partial [Singulisphaera sp.]|nr:hypothetical protein [Singulisphaera sp.]
VMLGPDGQPAADLREDLGGIPPCPGRVVQPAGNAMAAGLGLVVVARRVGWSGPCRFGGNGLCRRAGRGRRPERAGPGGLGGRRRRSGVGVILDVTVSGSPGGAGGRVEGRFDVLDRRRPGVAADEQRDPPAPSRRRAEDVQSPERRSDR